MPVLLRTALFTLAIPGALVGLAPWLVLRATGGVAISEGPQTIFGFGLIGLGMVAYLRCAYDFAFAGRGTPFVFDPPREFVARGLYRFTRNPIYLSYVCTVVGEALVWGSWWLAGYAALLWSGLRVFVVGYEEPGLRRRFGESYLRYHRAVPRWIGGRLLGELFEDSRRAALARRAALGGGLGAGLGLLLAVAAQLDAFGPWSNAFVFCGAGGAAVLFLAVLVSLPLALLRRFRANALATSLGCATFALATYTAYQLVAPPWQRHWELVAGRAEPLIAAIRRYEGEHGAPPSSLFMLLAGYIGEIPSTGTLEDSSFEYWVAEPETVVRRSWYDLGSRGGREKRGLWAYAEGDPEHAIVAFECSSDGVVREACLDRMPADPGSAVFDRDAWRSGTGRRLEMAGDLGRALAPVGRPMADIEAELGPPTGTTHLPNPAWILSVDADKPFDVFVYHSNETYPERIGHDWFERIGKWAYLHE